MYFVAVVELMVCWFGWAYPFILKAPHRQKRDSVTVTTPTVIGLILEGAGILIAFARRLPGNYAPSTGRMAASMALGPIAAALAWTSVKHLGRQFRMRAGLYADHELVRSGPYRIVRHPIYASVLAMLLSTLLLLTPWEWIALALVFFIAGTEIRVRAEDDLLQTRFGDDFSKYKKDVSAYIPFLR